LHFSQAAKFKKLKGHEEFHLGHTNLIPWIAGSGKIPSVGGSEKIK
jgi:hypothetical protein